ncbi:glycosyltransferase family 4 protein [Defluviitalea saccharophila]|uniref:Glycosyltransferase family 4 protein n=1 Tax=Defluviitalea saccharophila TaxID=879970 RepID=A0ABZ2Y4F8_9FIRM
MKVLYVAIRGELSEGSGVLKKIIAQVDGLNNCGVNTKGMIFYTKDPDKISRQFHNNIIFHEIKYTHSFFQKTWYKNLILYNKIIQEIQKEEFDLLYFRYPKASSQLLRLVKQFPFKIIFEHQTKELDEIKQTQGNSNKEYWVEKYLAPYIFGYVKGFVAVTNEIKRYERKRYSYYNSRNKKESLVLGNGMDVEKLPLRKVPPYDKAKLELLFVGQIAPWHGVDRVIKGIASYKGSVNITFHIVGTGNELKNLINLSKKLELHDRVLFYEELSGEQLDKLFNKCHIAVAPLALYRKNLNESSALKTREYVARGIPFITSHNDPDIKMKSSIRNYILRVNDNNEPIDIEEIIQFTNRMYQIDGFENHFREFALRSIDMKIKMQRLKQFFEKCFIEEK